MSIVRNVWDGVKLGEIVLIKHSSTGVPYVGLCQLMSWAKGKGYQVIVDDVLDTLYLYKTQMKLAGLNTSILNDVKVIKLGGRLEVGQVVGHLHIKEPVIREQEYGQIFEPLLGGGRVFLCDHVEKWELFLTLLNDRKGFVISREPPSLVERKLGSKEVPVLWLTKVEGENCVYPTRLPYLHQVLVDFMREGGAPKVIMLDGFEYLVLENGFKPVFKFLASLRDYVLLNNTIILLPVFKNALDGREYALLSREFSRVHSTS